MTHLSIPTTRKARLGPKLRRATLADYEQIAQLEGRHGHGENSYEEWSHVWLANPLYRELRDGWSIGWVLEDEHHQIVGSVGNIPLLYEFEGRRIVVATSRYWVAEAEYRSASLLLVDELINQRHVDLYLTNTVSVASMAFLSIFKCQRVPVGVWNESAFWITNYNGFVESFLALKGYPLGKPLSYPLAAVAFVKDRLTKKGLGGRDVEVNCCVVFDERFDDFWMELKRRSPRVLLAVRTREMLEWHYKYAMSRNQIWIATVVDGTRLIAYAVFDRKDKRRIRLKRVRLVDYQSLDGDTALLQPLLAWAVRRCRDEGIHILECRGRYLEQGDLLDVIAPYRCELPTWVYLYRANNPGLARSLEQRSAWAPSLFDSDASLGR